MPTPPRRRPSPPHNPGLRDLVEGKRDWDARDSKETQREGFRGWHERGYLPHRDAPGLTQFITYHLADAFPVALRSEWSALLEVEDDRVDSVLTELRGHMVAAADLRVPLKVEVGVGRNWDEAH